MKSIPIIWSSFDQHLTDAQFIGLEPRPKSISSLQEKLYRVLAEVIKYRCNESWMETIPMTAKSGSILRSDHSYGYGGYLHLDEEANLTLKMESSIEEFVEDLFVSLEDAMPHFTNLSVVDGVRIGSTPLKLTNAISKQYYAIEDRMTFRLISAIRQLGHKDEIQFSYQDSKNISRTIQIPAQSTKPQLEDHVEELIIGIEGLQFKNHEADIKIYTDKLKVKTKLHFNPEHSPMLYEAADPGAPHTLLKVEAKPESNFVDGRKLINGYQLLSVTQLVDSETQDLFE